MKVGCQGRDIWKGGDTRRRRRRTWADTKHLEDPIRRACWQIKLLGEGGGESKDPVSGSAGRTVGPFTEMKRTAGGVSTGGGAERSGDSQVGSCHSKAGWADRCTARLGLGRGCCGKAWHQNWFKEEASANIRGKKPQDGRLQRVRSGWQVGKVDGGQQGRSGSPTRQPGFQLLSPTYFSRATVPWGGRKCSADRGRRHPGLLRTEGTGK